MCVCAHLCVWRSAHGGVIGTAVENDKQAERKCSGSFSFLLNSCEKERAETRQSCSSKLCCWTNGLGEAEHGCLSVTTGMPPCWILMRALFLRTRYQTSTCSVQRKDLLSASVRLLISGSVLSHFSPSAPQTTWSSVVVPVRAWCCALPGFYEGNKQKNPNWQAMLNWSFSFKCSIKETHFAVSHLLHPNWGGNETQYTWRWIEAMSLLIALNQ